MTGKKNWVDTLAWVLLIVGGLNWGLVGFFQWNLVSTLFGEMTALTRVVYGLVGLSALYMLLMMGKMRKA